MFKDNTIGNRVLKVIKNRVANAQKNYDEGCITIDITAMAEKEILADKLVDTIIGVGAESNG